MSGLLGPVTANPLMLAQALKAKEQPRKQLTGQGLLDTAAIGLSPVPVIGDALGLAADASRFYNEPESRTPLNFGLAALGAIPFIPPLVSMGLGKFAQSQGKTLSAPSMSGPAKNQAGAIVYHGSPHKFDQFDSSKIGTGEGAQAYGHGLYFAENPKVAKSYQKDLTEFNGVNRPTFNGRDYDLNSPEGHALNLVYERGIKDARKLASKWIGTEKYSGKPDGYFDKLNQFLGSVNNKSEVGMTRGHLYKVDLPDEAIAKMLDWDKPLSQQGHLIERAALANAKPLKKEVKFFQSNPLHKEYSPQTIYDLHGSDLIRVLGRGGKSESILNDMGIPGIRYLDGGSRGAGQGTSNYVVFPGNEGLLKILERQ